MRLFRRRFKTPDGQWQTIKTWSVRVSVRGRVQEVSLGVRDRRAAEIEAGKLVQHAELDAVGAGDPFRKHRATPLATHIADFKTTLSARGVVKKYLADRIDCLEAFVEWANVKVLSDVDLAKASAWIADLKARPILTSDGQPTGVTLSPRTVNRHFQALRQFGLWLVRCQRIAFDPFAGLVPQNEAIDRRHVRRSFTPHEVAKLLAAARRRPLKLAEKQRTRAGVSEPERARLVALGGARAAIYAIAVGTGLRRGEIARLRWCDVDLERARVSVTAASAKSRREQSVDLHPNLVEELKAIRPRGAPTTDLVFAKSVFPSIRTFWADLARARIPRVDAEGRVVDFHALRHTFVTWLAASGAHPRTAQALARHASIETTMERYTDVRLLDLRGTVAKLPMPTLDRRAKTRCAPTPAENPLSLPLSLSGATSLQLVAPRAQEPREVEDAPDRQASRKYAQGTATRMERVMGLEPTTFSLGSRLPEVVTPCSDATSGEASRPLSPPLSLDPRTANSIRLARELLAQAGSASDPTALIAAARLLLTPAEASDSGIARNGAG